MINLNLTKEYKKILRDSGLVDSGKLVNSITIDLSLNGNDIIINIMSLPYLKYLVKDYKLNDKLTSSNAFKEEIGLLLSLISEEIIENILNGESESTNDPNIIIKYNGN